MDEKEIIFEGKKFLSLRTAAEFSGYHKDYIGRLARKNRISGLRFDFQWFIEKDSLENFILEKEKKAFANFKIINGKPKAILEADKSLLRPLVEDSATSNAADTWDAELFGGRAPIQKVISAGKTSDLPAGRAGVLTSSTSDVEEADVFSNVLKNRLAFSFGRLKELINLAKSNLRLPVDILNWLAMGLAGLLIVIGAWAVLENNAVQLNKIQVEAENTLAGIFLREEPLIPLPFDVDWAGESLGDVKNRVAGGLRMVGRYILSALTNFKKIALDFLFPPSPPSSTLGVETPKTPSVFPGGEESKIITFKEEVITPQGVGVTESSSPRFAGEAGIISRVLSSINLAQRFQELEDRLTNKVVAALSAIEKRIPPSIQNPVTFSTASVPSPYRLEPPQQVSGVSAGFGDFSQGISTGGNLSATGNITLGSDNKDVNISSKTWDITSAGAATGFTNVSTADLSVTTANISNATISGSLTVSSSATSTFANGISLTAGCFQLGDGTCLESANSAAGWSDDGSVIRLTASSDFVGIGTTSPYAKLSVVGQTVAEYFTATSTTATSTFAGGFSAGNNGGFIVAQIAPANSLYVTSSGRIGIATTSPSSTFSVQGDGFFSGTGFFGQTLTATSSAILARDGGSVGIASSSPWGLISVNPNGIAGPAFVVGSSTATNFIVTNGGNVGIGTTYPGTALSIQGIANLHTSTSTFYATGGLNLADGCFAIDGTCVAGTGAGMGITSLNGLNAQTQTFADNDYVDALSSGTIHTFNGTTSPFFGTIFASSTVRFSSLTNGVLAANSIGTLTASSTLTVNIGGTGTTTLTSGGIH